jgi:GntR family transcriptional regulator/MocR family aminotransferase
VEEICGSMPEMTTRTTSAAPATLWTTRLDRASPLPLSRQLAAALREALSEGRIDAGARLPSTRALAVELGLARSTVVGVFEQLAAEGYIAGRPGSGYFAASLAAPGAASRTAPVAPRPLSRYAERLRDHVRYPLPQGRPFELGRADIDNSLIATWKRLAARVLSGRTSIAWNYGDPQGEPALRRAIADYLAAARGVRCVPEQIVLTSGTQQGLSLIAQVLIDPGDAVWVEDPCYRAIIDILHAAEAEIVPVPVDKHGLDIAAGARRPGRPPRLVYTTPSRQYPLGMAMPLTRRAMLLDWAAQHAVWVIEDDYESEFQAPGHMLPSLQGLDRAGRVIYLGTFSKLVFPSVRLGYAVLPEDLVTPFAAARHLADRQSSGLIQAIMTEFMLDGHFARHLKRMRASYGERQHFLIDQLTRRLAGLVEIDPVESGMYLTAWLPWDWSDRATAAALAAAGVSSVPLSSATLETPRRPGLVLGYTGHSEAAITRAVETMATVLAKPTGLVDLSKADLRSDRLTA